LGGIKFSGNAQRRKRRALLFHGSILLQFDLAVISQLLPMPSKQPEYRLNRSHEDFLMNIGAPAEAVKQALRAAWNAQEESTSIPSGAITQLAAERYSTDEWNLKFV
jgi:lipoate---protein ligase